MSVPRPAPNSSASRSATVGRFRSRRRASRPALRAPDARTASGDRGDGQDDGEDARRAAEAVDERSPASEHRSVPLGQDGVGSCVRTHRECAFALSTPDDVAGARPVRYRCRSDRSLWRSHTVPRVTAAHEQQVRDRIVRAAVERVRREGLPPAPRSQTSSAISGLSVGAIYTYFQSKDELFLQSCDLITGQGLDELATGWRRDDDRGPARDGARVLRRDDRRVRAARPGQVGLVQAWAEADDEPGVREMLVRRREQLVGAGQLLLREGVARGELPGWLDVEGMARGLHRRCSTGCCSSAIEAGDGLPAGRARAPGAAILDLILPSACSRPARAPSAAPGWLAERRSIAADGARPDRPRTDRPRGPRVHAAARAHPDRAVAHPGPLGLLAAHAGRAADPRGARGVPRRPVAARSST